MSKLSRTFLKLFGSSGNSTNFGQFGSKTAGVPLKTKDIATIQGLSAWLNGWQDAVVGANKAPYLQDMNSLAYVLCYQLAYLFQDGIPAWDAETTYFTGSVVRRDLTAELFISLTDSNTGNALPTPANNNTNWQWVPMGTPPGTIIATGSNFIPNGYLLCGGQAISRSTYNTLFGYIGTAWGAGDGSTTFNVPALAGRTILGVSTGSPGDYGGSATHTHTQAAHSHTVAAHNHAIAALGLQASSISTAPFTLTKVHSQSGGGMGVNPVASGVGAVTDVFDIKPSTSPDNTGSAAPGTDSKTPIINPASSLPPYGTVFWMIKT